MDPLLKNTLIMDYSNPHIGTPDLFLLYPKGEEKAAAALADGLAKCYVQAVLPGRRMEECHLSLKLPAPSAHMLEDMARFFDSPEMVAVHYNCFLGVFTVDLSEWTDNYDSEYFEMLVTYVEEHRDDIRFIFMAQADEEEARGLIDALEQVVRLKCISVGYSDSDMMHEQAKELFKKANVQISKEADKSLEKLIVRLNELPDYSGRRSMERFVAECVDELKHSSGSRIFITGELMRQVFRRMAASGRKKKETPVYRVGFHMNG